MTTPRHRPRRRHRRPGSAGGAGRCSTRALAPFVFLLPFMAIFVVFRVWPLIQAVEFSFQDVQGLQGNEWLSWSGGPPATAQLDRSVVVSWEREPTRWTSSSGNRSMS